jgi:hypothetical protein
MYVTLVHTPFANLYDRHLCPRSLRGVLQSDSFAPYSGLITANYAGPDVLPNQSLRIVSMTVYLGSAAVVSYSTRPRFVASEALFLFCFHHATADEIGTMAGLFAPSGFLEGIKVLAPTPCAHLIVVTVTALRELNHSLLHPTTLLRSTTPIGVISHKVLHHCARVKPGVRPSSDATKPALSQNKRR